MVIDNKNKEVSLRTKGKLVSWDANKAYGFISPSTGGKNIFIHKSDFSNRKRQPQINDIITFTLSNDKKGRPCAIDATFTGEKLIKKQAQCSNKFSVYLALVFTAGLLVLVTFSNAPIELAYLYLGLSVFTFFSYGLDKYKAQKGSWRTPESTLHVLALFGGWPGAAIAQQVIRHKSKKKEFRFVFWITVILNLFAIGWLLSPKGRELLRLLA